MQTFKPTLQDLVLFLFAAALFSCSLGNGFVGDDLVHFIGNNTLMSFDIRKIVMSGALEVDYCPLRDVSLALDYLLWGEKPFGFHLSNLILYGFTVVAVRRLYAHLQLCFCTREGVEEVPSNAAGPFLAALLFAANPVHGEVVYAVNHRGILLAGLFATLTCLFYLKHLRHEKRGVWLYAGSLIFFFAAILSKEYSIIIPLVLVCLIVACDRTKIAQRLLGTLPFFLISAAFYVIFKSIAVSARFIAPTAESLLSGISSKIFVALQIMAYYLFRLVSAEGVGVALENNVQQPKTVLLIFSVAVLAVVFTISIVVRKRYPQILLGLILYCVFLIPVLNFFKTYPITADRFAYVPSIGLFLVVSAVSFEKRRFQLLALSCIILLASSISSIRQTVYWKDNLVFWEHIVSREPSLNNYANLGLLYMNANNPQKARGAFLKALEYVSESAGGTSRGDILLMLGDNEGAIEAFESVLARYKDSKEFGYYIVSWQLYNNLSKAYMNSGRYPEAIRALENSIKLRPDKAGLYNSLGVLYGEMKQFDIAIKAFEKALSLDANYGFAPLNLAKTYVAKGDLQNAEKFLAIVKERFPKLREEADLITRTLR